MATVLIAEDDKQIHWETALDEMAEAGFSVMETGPFGYFPKDPKRLQEEMDEFFNQGSGHLPAVGPSRGGDPDPDAVAAVAALLAAASRPVLILGTDAEFPDG